MKNLRKLIESIDEKQRNLDSLKRLKESGGVQGFSIDAAEGYRKIYFKSNGANDAQIFALLTFLDGEINAKQAELDAIRVKANALDELLGD